MPASVFPGFVFRPAARGAHCWVVVSPIQTDTEEVLAVNWTTCHEDSVDIECILEPGDHREITGRSTMAYSKAQVWKAAKIEAAVKEGLLKALEPVSSAVLSRIIEGAQASPQLQLAKKRMLVVLGSED